MIAATRNVNVKPYRTSVSIDAKLLQDVEEDGRSVRDEKKMDNKQESIFGEGLLNLTKNSRINVQHKHGDSSEQSKRNTSVALTSSDTGSNEEAFGLTMTDARPELKPRERKRKLRGLQYIKPKLPTKSYTLVPYVNEWVQSIVMVMVTLTLLYSVQVLALKDSSFRNGFQLRLFPRSGSLLTSILKLVRVNRMSGLVHTYCHMVCVNTARWQ